MTLPTTDPMYQEFLRMRRVRNPCPRCSGLGGYMYPSTALWMGGVGGKMFTWGVCDGCWGSGDDQLPWTDLRAERENRAAEIAVRAGELLSEAVGSRLNMTRPYIVKIATDIEAKLDKKNQDPLYKSLVGNLVKVLRAMSEPPKT